MYIQVMCCMYRLFDVHICPFRLWNMRARVTVDYCIYIE